VRQSRGPTPAEVIDYDDPICWCRVYYDTKENLRHNKWWLRPFENKEQRKYFPEEDFEKELRARREINGVIDLTYDSDEPVWTGIKEEQPQEYDLSGSVDSVSSDDNVICIDC